MANKHFQNKLCDKYYFVKQPNMYLIYLVNHVVMETVIPKYYRQRVEYFCGKSKYMELFM